MDSLFVLDTRFLTEEVSYQNWFIRISIGQSYYNLVTKK
ncbi:hypothetical protein MGA5115_01376 [Marinomonas gallaica]|uniref:Uncharacterized protein n=1 Tax=Marinomonas gallaica TaxID=1806667 RepID=A0A1C3JQ73_9GAMM|nr:hypothetical protein MGA5115_01376 [Marinomonas gallaica]SBT22289.1 hypothetical protein MGA5116_02905 [Marinomonas gallaica]